jgi:hypothetical protein
MRDFIALRISSSSRFRAHLRYSTAASATRNPAATAHSTHTSVSPFTTVRAPGKRPGRHSKYCTTRSRISGSRPPTIGGIRDRAARRALLLQLPDDSPLEPSAELSRGARSQSPLPVAARAARPDPNPRCPKSARRMLLKVGDSAVAPSQDQIVDSVHRKSRLRTTAEPVCSKHITLLGVKVRSSPPEEPVFLEEPSK